MYKKTRTAGFGEEVKRRIMLGSFVLSSGYYDAYYLKALRTKALIKKEFDQAFGKYDVLLAPASPFTAPKIGESLKDPLASWKRKSCVQHTPMKPAAAPLPCQEKEAPDNETVRNSHRT